MHTALSAAYGTVYTCPMGRLQCWCLYLVVCDAVLDNNNNNNGLRDAISHLLLAEIPSVFKMGTLY